MAADSGIDPRHPARFQRGFDPNAHPAVPPPVPQAVSAAEILGEEPSAPRRPRVEWTLLLTGIGLLLGGAGLTWSSVRYSIDTYRGLSGALDLGERIWAVALDTLPGPLVAAGIVAVCAWIVVRALPLTRGAS